MRGDLNHPFYQRSIRQQFTIQVCIAIAALLLLLLIFLIAWYSSLYFLLALAFMITLSLIAPFFDVPALRKSGGLVYRSPLFLTEKPKNGVMRIHGGTLLDYIFVIDRQKTGNQRTTFILQQYLQGLLQILEEHQREPELRLRGTSYILNERTAQRLGFESIRTEPLQKLILIYNYPNLMLCASIAKGRLSFPHLARIKTFETDLATLSRNKEFIQQLQQKLKC